MKKISLAALLLLSSYSAFAVDVFGDDIPTIWKKVITVSAGPAWTRLSESHTNFSPELSIRYLGNTTWRQLGIGEIYFAVQKEAFKCIDGQFGIAAAGTSNVLVQGVMNIQGTPDTYLYKYKLNQGRVTLKGVLFSQYPQIFQPYISAGLGISFNHSYSARVIPVTVPTTPTPYFGVNTSTGFAFTVGGGFQIPVGKFWKVGAGYELAGWGKSRLGEWTGYRADLSPKLENLLTHELVFSLSYIVNECGWLC